jgi:anhydro-N-acetylmuramic acid kinase
MKARPSTSPKSMVVAGIMSGTSADGIDVALVRITSQTGSAHPRINLLQHSAFSFSAALRRSVLAAMNAASISTAELARLNWRLGLAYAEAVQKTLATHPVRLQLVGCHGQTLYHQAESAPYIGSRFSCTWQAGEAALIASAVGVPVVSNFRPADMAAGGLGAPLVPLLDFVYFRHAKRGRVLQNIGGIGNLTTIPPAATLDSVRAFDTGPGNMIMDELMQALFQRSYDRNGKIASQGQVLKTPLQSALRHRFFSATPPKAAGREEFGREFTAHFLRECRKHSKRPEDAIATATALTAESISLAYKQFVSPEMKTSAVDYILSGGGARNATLVNMLQERLSPLGCRVSSSEDFGLPTQAKEAVAFALLAWQTWNHLPGNVPSATGAVRPAILGQLTYA